jgi:hypothetical protein
MTNELRQSLWRQFGGSIDMLQNVISSCPDDFFSTHKRFYYIAYHSIIFLDYYLTIPPKDFSPRLTFTIKEANESPAEAIDDLIPDRTYSKQELLDYIQASRDKCRKIINSLTEETVHKRFTEEFETNAMDYSMLEILLYNLRHTQHHAAQLNLLMRQDLNSHMEWAFRAKDEL